MLLILERLWQAKFESVALLTTWLEESSDSDPKAGFQIQLEDEGRHLRSIGEQTLRLGGRLSSERRERTMESIFDAIGELESDAEKLVAFYRGVKLFQSVKCAQSLAYADIPLSNALELIARDDERHVRWADARIQRVMGPPDIRDCNRVCRKIERSMELVWQRAWLDVVSGGERRSSPA